MKKNFSLLFIFLGVTIIWSQNLERRYVSHKNNVGGLEIETTDGKYIIQSYSDKIVSTTFVHKTATLNTESHAVVLKPVNNIFELKQTGSYVEATYGEVAVLVYKFPFQISYYYKGKLIISERVGFHQNETHDIIDFNIESKEVLYGGGARALGMNRRGNKLQLYNRAHYGYEKKSELMNYTMPLVLSSKMYAVHFDNPTTGFLDLDSRKKNVLQYEAHDGPMRYQVIVGDSWPDLINEYTNLTGKQPLPPRWTFGNFASRFGYHSEKETRKVVSEFRSANIPLDAVILDLYWFGKEVKGTMGNLEFHKDSFPNYQGMISDFRSNGVKTVLITEPFILTTSSKWKEAVDKKILATNAKSEPYTYDFFFGNTGLIDIFKPEGKDWFWNVYKKYASEGVAGWWGDLGEPEVHPTDIIHGQGKKADEVHNIYGHEWAKLVFEGYKKDFPDQRPFILMRAGYSGSQRFGLIPWSGDVNRTWGGLYPQPEISLQMGMQGLAYMHSDLGGFAGANLDDDLYIRWLQYGVFQPVFRPHAQEDVPSEPVFRADNVKKLAKKAIELRYSMLPYNYSLAYDNNQKGLPFMRPLFFNDPENESLLTYSESYMWGDSFLVAPVLEPGKLEQEVYFPSRSNWYDFATEEKFTGGEKAKIILREDNIPMFIKSGAFVPMVEPVQTTESYNTKNLTVHYFYDTTNNISHTHLYDDDGKTPNPVEAGKYELLNIDGILDKGFIDINVESKLGASYEGIDRNIVFVFHNVQDKPVNMKINGDNAPRDWDNKKKTLRVPLTLTKGTKATIRVQFYGHYTLEKR